MGSLRYASDTEPGIRRIRGGRGFRYVGPDGKPVTSVATLERIRALAIPPAYTKVWICRSGSGHLQATGYDSRHRKQYRYHREWRRIRDADKFDRLVAFAAALPVIRRKIRTDLARSGLDRSKVVAVVATLLDSTGVRIGNDEYVRSNRSYGLTTLRDRHLHFANARRLRLRFRGKGGAWNDVQVDDARLARIVRRCQQLPGQSLFQYRDEQGKARPVNSGMVNHYLRTVSGAAITAKDFRVWHATVCAVDMLVGQSPTGKVDDERRIRETVAMVAARLHHSPAVCRKSYIHPGVFTAWRGGLLSRLSDGERRTRASRERLTVRILRRSNASR